jgi:hypothetical protein
MKFRLYTYDVWGNEEEGYDVNDVFQTGEIYNLHSDMTDGEIIEALQTQGGIQEGIDTTLIDIGGDFDLGLTFDYNGRPEFELRPE